MSEAPDSGYELRQDNEMVKALDEAAFITKVSEALALLRTLVERAGEVGQVLPPIRLMVDNHMGPSSGSLLKDCMTLVPAMVKGAEAVLELHNSVHAIPEPITASAIDVAVTTLANAYYPAMVELEWVPK